MAENNTQRKGHLSKLCFSKTSQHNKFCVKEHFLHENSELQCSVSITENVFGWQ